MTTAQPSLPCAPWEEAADGPDADAPLVLAAPGPHGPVVHAANPAALTGGTKRGMRLTDARALTPELQVVEADLRGDAEALRRLTLWSRRWCPWSASDGADGLVLDTTGSDHLWGGEAAILADMEMRLADLGQDARLAVAPTHGAAWALARYGDLRENCGPSALKARLAMLPVAALRLDGATLLTLRRLGIKRIGDLMLIPRATLERRFGRDGRALMTPLRRLDQMTGDLPEPIVSPAPPQRFRVVHRLAEPVMDPQPLLPEPLGMLCAEMADAGQGLRGIRLELYRTDGTASRFETGCSQASRDPAHLLNLMARHFESLDAGFGFDTLSLEALRPEPLSAAQIRLDGGVQSDVALATLIDRLAVRLGPQAVQLPDPRESHLPERADAWSPAVRRADLLAPGGLGGGGMIAASRERPVRLLHAPERIEVLYAVPEGPPVRFKWRRKPYVIRRHQGPERIAPEWWRARPGTRLRDYYKVEVEAGERYWLFREGILGDGRGDTPDWFLHGLFA
ncbi:DNA polymerase IV [Jannaschia donghaensis]|uniref:DNA polymerase IV n=1 Tax=Jannaschia donghaensis TaxID=420998 RepID=A0A0M6YGN0_9RHOB|nr:DNA polymerase IV [Jannaschia donghaensis]